MNKIKAVVLLIALSSCITTRQKSPYNDRPGWDPKYLDRHDNRV